MTFYAASALANCITTFLLGAIVFLRNPRSKLNITFFIFSLDISLWSFAYYIWQISETAAGALFWSRVLMAFAIFIPVFYLHFIYTLTGNEKRKRYFLLFSYLIFAVVLVADVFSPYFIGSVRPIMNFRFWPVAGPLYLLFLALWISLMIYNVFFLYSFQRKSAGYLKIQIKYALLGFVIGLIGGITNYFMWFGIPIPPFGNVLVTAYVALNAYAIIKHRFFDIRLILARTISFTVLTITLAVAYALFFGVLSSLLINSEMQIKTIAISTVIALAMAFSFQPLRRVLEMASDKIFFKGGYDSARLLSRLGSIMSVNIELKPLTSQVLEALIKEMKITKGAFVILGEGIASIYDVIDQGFKEKPFLSYQEVSAFLPFIEPVIFDDLEENHLKILMRNMDIALVRTLKVKNGVVGLLFLGTKESGEIYSDQDLKVFEILAPEMAVAVQNAMSYDKIKKFNVVLTQEVNKATAELRGANQKLQVLDRLKDDFVSIASHELRTPMTAIRSYAWMALHRSDVPLSKTLEKYIARILISTERLVNLVNDMLNISRIESGKIEIVPEPVDLLSLVRDIVDEVYYSKSEEKKIEFVVVDKPVPKAFADPEKLRQVFLNLVGNSMKFTPNGGKITFDFFSDGMTVEISVSDTGVGMSKEDLSKLFQKFSRLDNSYTAAATSGGTGLGLYISKNLVELMHGKIKATSEGAGKGSTFTVTLPVATPDVLKDVEKYTVRVQGEAKPLEPAAI